MSNPLDPVRIAFDKAVGPHQKRQNLIAILKEEDVGKDRRAQIVKETSQLDAEWVAALIELRKVMDDCSALRQKKDA
ncbi:MAG: hypothetical protein M1511_17480 [Deltaproteobacteria bacterium]|nr:hypothetical protein [Deltaproteobacteria bacterium]